MDIRYLKNLFPDVCKQVFDFDCVFSRREIEDKVIQFSDMFGQQAMVYVRSGKRLVDF